MIRFFFLLLIFSGAVFVFIQCFNKITLSDYSRAVKLTLKLVASVVVGWLALFVMTVVSTLSI